ncbi:MAG: hypothetical protein ACFE0I_07540 [Elainellaceae cyanobacterium]
MNYSTALLMLLVSLGIGLLGCSETTQESSSLEQPTEATSDTPADTAEPEASPSPSDSSTSLPERDAFAPIDVSRIPSDAFENMTDPKSIAVVLFGVEEPDAVEGNFEQRVSMYETSSDRVIVTLTQLNQADDSVRDVRYRLEFEPAPESDDAQWQLVWAGRQQRCWQGRGPQEWTTELCA